MLLRVVTAGLLGGLSIVTATAQGVILQTGGAGQAWPRYGYGYTATWTLNFHTVTVSNPDGTRRWSMPLNIPNVRSSVIRDAAICPGGDLVLATTLTSADGQVVAANVRVDANGKVADVVRTSPYAAKALACAPSGAVWSAGTERDSTSREKAEYTVIRRYNAAGVQDAERLHRSEAGGHPWGPADRAFLRADDDGFVLLSTRIQKIFLAQAPDFQVRQATFVPPAGCGEVTGVALLKDVITVSCVNSSSSGPGGETTFSLVTLDRVSGAFVKPPAPIAGPVALLGEDSGQAVLFRTRGREIVKFAP